jgi:hypothetical protein
MRRTWTTRMGCAVIVLCVEATLAWAAPMVCTTATQRILSSPMPYAVRRDCVQATKADGVVVDVNVPDTKVGDRIDCDGDTNGKVVCKNTPYAFSGGGAVVK